MRLIVTGLIAVVLVAFVFLFIDPKQILFGYKIGVVLMHGKRGNPGANAALGPLEEAIRESGIKVIAPVMPWSRERFLDETFQEILAEIDEAVKSLKRSGADKIVIGGHSLGGNVALAYGARRGGIAGILVIAPGHSPESRGFQNRFGDDLARAKSMIASGRGEDKEDFGDINQGQTDSFSMKAKIYADLMDPDGPLVMPKNAGSLQKGTALMLIIGKKDRAFRFGRGQQDYIFDQAQPHPKSVYKVVHGGHKATPRIGKDEIIAWLKTL